MTAYERLKQIRDIVQSIEFVDESDSWNVLYHKAFVMGEAVAHIEDILDDYESLLGHEVA